MTVNHDAVAASGVNGGAAANKTLLRSLYVARFPYCLADDEDSQQLIAVDPNTGSIITDILFLGRVFHYDPLDTTTAHDGTSCLVSSDGKRYKLAQNEDVIAWSVLDVTRTAPPSSPSIGDAHIVASAATGDWSGHDGEVAVRTARGWEFVTYAIGRLIYDEGGDAYYHRDSSGDWVAGFGTQVIGANSVGPGALVNAGAGYILRVENQTTNAPPASPVVGDAYIIGSSPTGSWAGKATYIAVCEVAGTFSTYQPKTGYVVFDKSANTSYEFNGTSWVSAGGSCVASPLPQFDSGNTFTNVSGTAFNWTAAGITTYPSSVTNAHLKDPLTITHTAKKSGNLLEFEFDITPGSNWHLYVPVFCLMRDSESTPLDKWETYDASTKRNVMKFSIVSGDALPHTYRIYVFGTNTTYGGFNSTNPPFYNRRFSVKEYNQ